LKIIRPISPYLSRESSELHEFWYVITNFDPGDVNVTKFRKSQIQNGGWTPHCKSLFGYNSAVYSPIKMKFGVRRQNQTRTTTKVR